MSRHFLVTVPQKYFLGAFASLPDGVDYIKGQLELSDSGLLHWQLVVGTTKKSRYTAVPKLFNCKEMHVEQMRSEAALKYVHKEETSVNGTRFEIGHPPIQMNKKHDYNQIWELAKKGKIEEIDPCLRVRHYRTLRQIEYDYSNARPMERSVNCYWGVTRSGKSHRAYHEAGSEAYWKASTTKWWCGYRGEENVIIDEFSGKIGLDHLLRWFDRYPVSYETKGGGCVSRVKNFWITSNIDPRKWYPDETPDRISALMRRMKVVHFPIEYGWVWGGYNEKILEI